MADQSRVPMTMTNTAGSVVLVVEDVVDVLLLVELLLVELLLVELLLVELLLVVLLLVELVLVELVLVAVLLVVVVPAPMQEPSTVDLETLKSVAPMFVMLPSTNLTLYESPPPISNRT